MKESKPQMFRRRFLRQSAGVFMGSWSLAAMADRLHQPGLGTSELEALQPEGEPDEAYWNRLRERFLLPDDLDYMNNGSLGPVPRSVLMANAATAEHIAQDPIDYQMTAQREAVRGRLAVFVGADSEEIALTRSTTEGMNVFAHGLDWRPGDEVVMSSHEHPGGFGAYKTLEARRGIRIRWIELPTPPRDAAQILDAYERAVGPRTRLLVVSHIVFVTGLLMPVRALADLAHRKGLLISVDGAHPLGMLRLNLHELGCDHYAASGQKWLLGGTGSGLCYVRGGIQNQVWPLMGYFDPNKGDAKHGGARRYELTGQKNLPAVSGMGAAVAFQQAIGARHIEDRVRYLGKRLRDGLRDIEGVMVWTPSDPHMSAGLTAFSVGSVPMHNLTKAIRERTGIYLIAMPVGDLNAVRVSTHFYNTAEQVGKLLKVVRHVAENELDFV